jgi:hypothetical protein
MFVGGGEWSCSTDTLGPDATTTDGVFQVFIDTSDLITGDQVIIRAYEKTRLVDTQRVVFQSVLTGSQPNPIWASPFLILMHGWDFTFEALASASGSVTLIFSVRQAA